MTIDELINDHSVRYPKHSIIDMVKLLYQSEFGCGHYVEEEAISLARIQDEIHQVIKDGHRKKQAKLIESIGDEYVRVYLDAVEELGISVVTLNRIFVLSSHYKTGTVEGFEKKLSLLQEMYEKTRQTEKLEELLRYQTEYKVLGYPPVSHSDVYRKAYQPAYRVVHKDYIQWWNIFVKMDEIINHGDRAVIAIEGGSGAGKSTLGQLLSSVYKGNLYHMDDYFLRPEQRVDNRNAEIGGNVDYERFHDEVIKGIQTGKSFTYQPFSCKTMTMAEAVKVDPSMVHIIEGVYSLHPTLASCYNLKIFLNIDKEVQKGRILKRNGESMYRRFVEEWIPKEDLYFETFQVANQCLDLSHSW